jgi:hypothetical protein
MSRQKSTVCEVSKGLIKTENLEKKRRQIQKTWDKRRSTLNPTSTRHVLIMNKIQLICMAA